MVVIIDTSISQKQGRNREGPSEGLERSGRRANARATERSGNPECKAMSRRTETAYKAQSPGELAQRNEAQGSGDRVNATVV